MTSDGEALVRAIIDQPDDDLPRLVYADWLEENGQPLRAEFIRVQIAIATQTDRREALELRWKEIWKQQRDEWLAELPSSPNIDWLEWQRGFPEGVAFVGDQVFHDMAETVFDAAPVQRVQVNGLRTETCGAVVFSRQMSRVRSLSFLYSNIGNMGVEFMLAANLFQNLEELDLNNNGIGDHAVMSMAAKDALPSLRTLVLSHNHVTDSGAQALARSRFLGNLKRIYVVDNPIGTAGLTALRDRFKVIEAQR